VEADGDIHLALQDANGNNVGTVSAEIPVGPKWCEIRQIVFGWTTQEFPFAVKTAHTLKISEPHVITVTAEAFFDFAHAPADHSNRRTTPKDYAVWEIHPVGVHNKVPSVVTVRVCADFCSLTSGFTSACLQTSASRHKDGDALRADTLR
jgi:hypothetical protein